MPACSASSGAAAEPTAPGARRVMPKMLPTDTLQSMLELPSSGSKATMYLASLASATTMGDSCSSLTISATRLVWRSELQKISSDSTSSRFTWSPVALVPPSTPYRPMRPARRTAEEMDLQAVEMAARMRERSPAACACFCWLARMKRVRVTMSELIPWDMVVVEKEQKVKKRALPFSGSKHF